MPTTPVATTLIATADVASVDETLDRLEKVGKAAQDFTADATLTTIDNLSGDQTARLGKVYYQTHDSDSRIRVSFDTYEKGDKQFDEKIEYVLQKGVLTDRNYKVRSRSADRCLSRAKRPTCSSLARPVPAADRARRNRCTSYSRSPSSPPRKRTLLTPFISARPAADAVRTASSRRSTCGWM